MSRASPATVVAIDPNWDVTPTGTVTYLVLGAPPATGAVQAELGRLDVAVSSRAAIADYTTARAAKLDNLDATISSRSAPATAQTIDQTTALPGSPVAGSVGEALKRADTNCDATVSSRSTLAAGAAMTLTAGERTAIADAHLDEAAGVEAGLTPRQHHRLVAAALYGKASGLPNSPVFRDTNDTKNRITATTDASGNRTVVTKDGT